MHFYDSFFICYLAAHNQPWDITEGAASLNRCLSLQFVYTRPKGHQETHKTVGFLSLGKHLVRFELGTYQFIHHTLTH